MEFEYYPCEIAWALCEIANDENDEIVESVENALYQLAAIAENEYNCDYWRHFYKMLEHIVTEVYYK